MYAQGSQFLPVIAMQPGAVLCMKRRALGFPPLSYDGKWCITQTSYKGISFNVILGGHDDVYH